MKMIYPVQLTPDVQDGGYTVTCRDIPEVITQGNTIIHAVSEASDALDEAIASRMKRNADIPAPSRKQPGEQMAAVPLSTSLKAALYLAMREDHISKTELARQLCVDEKEVRRMLDPLHPSKTPNLERALGCIGRFVVAEFRKAA